MQVVFVMLVQFFFCWVLQCWVQCVQYLLYWQLGWCIWVIVVDWNVGCFVWFDCQVDVDQVCVYCIQCVGFGVEVDQVGLLQVFDLGLQLFGGQNGFVFIWCGQCWIQCVGGGCFDVVMCEVGRGIVQVWGGFVGCCWCWYRCIQFFQCLGEVVVCIQFGQFWYVLFVQCQVGWVGFQFYIGVDGYQFVVQWQVFQCGVQVFVDFVFYGWCGCYYFVQVLVFGQLFGSGFWFVFFYVWYVVDCVVYQCQQVDDLIGVYVEFVYYCCVGIYVVVGYGIDQFDVWVYQLGEVFVVGGDGYFQVLCQVLQCQCVDYIVGFYVGDVQDVDVQCFDDVVYWFDLVVQFIGYWWVVGFVLVVQVIMEGFVGCIDYECDVGWVFFQC